jgi:hypothetical protein
VKPGKEQLAVMAMVVVVVVVVNSGQDLIIILAMDQGRELLKVT